MSRRKATQNKLPRNAVCVCSCSLYLLCRQCWQNVASSARLKSTKQFCLSKATKGRKGVFVIKSDAILKSRFWGNILQATAMLRCAPLLVKTVQNTLKAFLNCTHFFRCLNCTQFFRCPCRWIPRRQGNTKYQCYFYVWTPNLLDRECDHMFVGRSPFWTANCFAHILWLDEDLEGLVSIAVHGDDERQSSAADTGWCRSH